MLLTVSEHGRLRVLGVNPCAGVRYTWIPDGDCPGNLSLGRHTGDGKSDGETFLGRTWMFFLGGTGGEEKAPGHGQQGRSLDDTRFQTVPFYYILYIVQWKFRCSMRQEITNDGPDPRCPGAWADRYAVQASTTRRPSPHIEDDGGVVAPRSATDSTEQWV